MINIILIFYVLPMLLIIIAAKKRFMTKDEEVVMAFWFSLVPMVNLVIILVEGVPLLLKKFVNPSIEKFFGVKNDDTTSSS